ncbi:MAG: Cupin 2 conserved barrel domain protein [Alphaproteobacteria bacterium]|nr:Cupin 2 conserved barrel domain protein [Alphaproteobacteria bacterium]
MDMRRPVRTALSAALIAVGGTSFAATGTASVDQAFKYPIANIPGKSISAFVVTYKPGGKSHPHSHSHSAFVTAYVLLGAVRTQVDRGAVKIYHAGESWTENPGAHHDLSENASTTRPAKVLAIFVADSDDTNLTTMDKN